MSARHSHVVPVISALGVLLVVMGPRAVDGLPIPGVPGVPGVNAQQIAIQAAAKQLTPWVDANQPVIHDFDAVYPTTKVLPGKPFSPIADPKVLRPMYKYLGKQLMHSSTGDVMFPVGDYAFPTTVFCTSWYSGNIHRGYAGHRGVWLLGPLRGSRADILAVMYARAGTRGVSFSDVQTVSWALQAGMKYDQFPTRSKQLVDQLIPDFKPRIMASFPDQVRDQWNKIASTIPNVPSFDSSIASMGAVGQTIVDMRNVSDQIIADADNFDALSHGLAPPGGAHGDQDVGDPPWSIVTDGVYERVITLGYLGSAATLQIRVTPPSSSINPSNGSGTVIASTTVADYKGLPGRVVCGPENEEFFIITGNECRRAINFTNNTIVPYVDRDWQPLTIDWDSNSVSQYWHNNTGL
jgi:hypothetical protein